MPDALSVLFVTPECAPLVKVGGLGDVSAALPAALREQGIDVRLLLPAYGSVLEASGSTRIAAELDVFATLPKARIREARLSNGVPLFLVDHALYTRDGGPYQDPDGEDWPDNALRFGLLSRIAAQIGQRSSPLTWRPRLLHLNDWPAALAAAYVRLSPEPRLPTVFTVHNLAFQGNFEAAMLDALQMPSDRFNPEGLEFHGRLSFLKAGLVYADAITTVSPRYAEEIQSAAYGAGMEGVLQQRRAVLSGILNGIDTTQWDPGRDRMLPHRYTRDSLDDKFRLKQALREHMRLTATTDVPLAGFVGRLTHQKGIDLLIAAAPALASLVQIAVLGSGQREHEAALIELARRFPERIAVRVGFDDRLAHLIEAGADMFLMPSRFEPCGLNQMYSQRYGTPPIAHATGGLADTIVDCTRESLALGRASGFLFPDPSAPSLIAAVERAVAAYRAPETWRSLQRNGMDRDFSWTEPARRYAALYRRLAQGADPP
ncbi:MAG TPA: glycogen synthase GlgA [Burkholderiales bacterium]|nr:glycogen synthase GlgA [Burkholderiales bacterium]